jgi:hypothetical protein
MKELKSQYQDERAFLVGNGPSLNETPLEEMKTEVTFATNRINKIYDDTDWRPTFYAYTQSPPLSSEVYECIMETVNEGIPSFISAKYEDQIPSRDNLYFLPCENQLDDHYRCHGNPSVPVERRHLWSDDVTDRLYVYNSSLYPLFQLAHYMGFERLYLVGCDMGIDTDWWPILENASDPIFFHQQYGDKYNSQLHKFVDFVIQSEVPLKSMINALALKFDRIPHAIYNDKTRFADQYLEKPYIQRGVDDCIRRACDLANIKLSQRNVDIYNATIGGELEMFPRVDITDILENSSR